LENYKNLNNLEGGTMLHMVTSIAVPAGPGPRFGDWPLYGRAMHEFYGGPYYSNVTVQLEDAGMPEETGYAQLRLLFGSTFRDVCSGLHVQKSLAFVQWYEEVPSSGLARMLKCKYLSWVCDSGSSIRRGKSRTTSNTGESYAIVEISNILQVIHVVPNFMEEGQFFVNRYKF
jgi:hypothetical protein